MINRYAKILRADEELYRASRVLEKDCNGGFDALSLNVFSPVVVMYALYILRQAEKRGIRRLYFLARDGYLVYKAATALCKKNGLDIHCSYFYCSRYSLRMAAYRFHDDSAFDRLFIYSYRLTAENMLCRGGFTPEEREKVYSEIAFDGSAEADIMDRKTFDEFCGRVKKSAAFEEILQRKSDAAYDNIVSYIKKEGLGDYDSIGIVDLGWTGSLQYTLRRLLDSMDIKTTITGFYVGMLEKPKSSDGSSYDTWLFTEKSKRIKAWFAHNLLECLFSAPHGMTVGYEKHGDDVQPVLSDSENDSRYVKTIEDITLKLIESGSLKYNDAHRKIALKLFKKIMFSPSKEDAKALCGYNFCDDIGEQYHSSIAQSVSGKQLSKELLFHKLFHREETGGLYWYCGSTVLSDIRFKTFYRYGFFLTKLIVSLLR